MILHKTDGSISTYLVQYFFGTFNRTLPLLLFLPAVSMFYNRYNSIEVIVL